METAEFTQLISERNASVVLERSDLSYEELLALLDVELVNSPARYNSPLHPAAEEARLADSRS